MKKISQLLLGFCFSAGIWASLPAQDLSDYVSKYTSENGMKYMQPLADAFGANLNSGLFQSARVSESGFHIYLGVETVAAIIADDQKTFLAKTEAPFAPAQTAVAPTVFGSGQGAAVSGTGGTVFNFPGGLDLANLPQAALQVRVGSWKGTEVSLRFISVKIDDNIGRVELLGFGARHSLSQYLKNSPVDLAVGFFIQKFDAGKIVAADASYFGLQTSHAFGVMTLYGGFGFESARLDVSYESAGNQPIAFSLDSSNSIRLTTGLAVNVGVAGFHIDYNFAAQNVVALGFGFEF
jgi:hypothetical protein